MKITIDTERGLFIVPNTFFILKRELLWIQIYGWAFWRAGMIGVNRARGKTNMKQLAAAVENRVLNGSTLVIFPEGTRSKDCKPKCAKRGISVIARAAKADVLPVSIYTETDMSKGVKLTVRFGEMIPFEKLGIGGDDCTKQKMTEAANYIMEEIVKLWEAGHCE